MHGPKSHVKAVLQRKILAKPGGCDRLRQSRVTAEKGGFVSDILDEEAMLREELARLEEDHRALDAAIDALSQSGIYNQLQVQRLKKRKLVLKDQIACINDQLTPDIIA